jgi:hypothetical protein
MLVAFTVVIFQLPFGDPAPTTRDGYKFQNNVACYALKFFVAEAEAKKEHPRTRTFCPRKASMLFCLMTLCSESMP